MVEDPKDIEVLQGRLRMAYTPLRDTTGFSEPLIISTRVLRLAMGIEDQPGTPVRDSVEMVSAIQASLICEV